YVLGEIDVANTPAFTHLVLDYSLGGTVVAVLDGDGTQDRIDSYASLYGQDPFSTIHYNVNDVADVTVKHGNYVQVRVDRTDVPTSVIGNTTFGYGKVDLGMRYILAPLSIFNPTGYTELGLHDSEDPSAKVVQVN